MQPVAAASNAAHSAVPTGEAIPALTIRDCSDARAWNSYVAGNAGGTFYHLHEWSRINRERLGHDSRMLMAEAGGQIQGVLPLTLVSSRLFGRILCSMPFVNYGGPCAANPATAASLVDAARALAADTKANYLELRCAAPLATDMPASTRKISMTLALEDDPEKVFAKYTSKHRTNIRRSYKNELSVKAGGAELLPVFYSILEESWRSLGTPLYARSYFETILKTFPEYTRLYVCMQRDTPIAATFNGEFNGTVEGMWAGGTAASRALQANYVLYWEMIQDACKRGLKRFHLGRSTSDSGAEDFKKKWNADALQLYWYHHVPNGGAPPALNVDNPKFKLAIAAWRRMPLWMTRIVGPPIARGIP